MTDDVATDDTLQTFACAVCDQKYRLKCDYPIDRITVRCCRCGDPDAWCYPETETDRGGEQR